VRDGRWRSTVGNTDMYVTCHVQSLDPVNDREKTLFTMYDVKVCCYLLSHILSCSLCAQMTSYLLCLFEILYMFRKLWHGGRVYPFVTDCLSSAVGFVVTDQDLTVYQLFPRPRQHLKKKRTQIHNLNRDSIQDCGVPHSVFNSDSESEIRKRLWLNCCVISRDTEGICLYIFMFLLSSHQWILMEGNSVSVFKFYISSSHLFNLIQGNFSLTKNDMTLFGSSSRAFFVQKKNVT